MDPTGEEEASGPWFDAALQKGADVPPSGHAAVAGEEGVLLAEDPRGADLDDRGAEVLVLLHGPDVASHHCGEDRTKVVTVRPTEPRFVVYVSTYA